MLRFRTRALRLAAVVIALTTAFVVMRDLRALHQRAADLGPLRPVVLAARPLPAGHRVTASDVRVVSRYRSQVEPDALQASPEVVGTTVRVGLLPGDTVSAAHVTREGTSGIVPPGRVAVRIADDAGLSPEPGAHVDVYATEADSATAAARLVVRDAIVLDPPRAKNPDGFADVTPSTATSALTVLIRRSEAPRLAFAVANGTLFVVIAPLERDCCRP